MQGIADFGGQDSLRVMTAWDHEVSLERSSYRILEPKSRIAAQMYPVLSKQQTHISGNVVNRFEWNYIPSTAGPRSNGLMVSYMRNQRVSSYF